MIWIAVIGIISPSSLSTTIVFPQDKLGYVHESESKHPWRLLGRHVFWWSVLAPRVAYHDIVLEGGV